MIALRGLNETVRPYAEYAHRIADYYGIPTTVHSVFRSWSSQARLRRNYERCVGQGRFPSSPDCLFPANLPGDSSHQYGLSWDSSSSPTNEANWRLIREYVGFHVPAHDAPHAEVPGWRQYVL